MQLWQGLRAQSLFFLHEAHIAEALEPLVQWQCQGNRTGQSNR